MRRPLLVICLVAGAAGGARGQAVQVPAADRAADGRLSVTLSPVHLFVGPIAELTGELRLTRHLGLALVAGLGRMSVHPVGGDAELDASVWEIGGQLNLYRRAFDGWHLGIEPLYLSATASGADVVARGSGLALGGYVGYKHIFDFGLTAVVQAGVDLMVRQAEDPAGRSLSDGKAFLLLNLNAGWSF